MTGYAIALGGCYCCGQVFEFNPLKVPSFEGEPICEPCVRKVNEARAAHVPPRPLFTWDDDAYGPVEAGQL